MSDWQQQSGTRVAQIVTRCLDTTIKEKLDAIVDGNGPHWLYKTQQLMPSPNFHQIFIGPCSSTMTWFDLNCVEKGSDGRYYAFCLLRYDEIEKLRQSIVSGKQIAPERRGHIYYQGVANTLDNAKRIAEKNKVLWALR